MKAKGKRRAPNPEHAEKNMFCGLLYCANCGSPLWFNVNHPNTDIKYFMCSNYKGRRGTCEGTHYVRADSLEQIVPLELRSLASFLVEDEEAFADILEAKTNKSILSQQKFLESSIDKSMARTKEVVKKEEELTSKLSDEEKEEFSNYVSTYNEFSSMSICDGFVSGFRFGARFTYDTFVK